MAAPAETNRSRIVVVEDTPAHRDVVAAVINRVFNKAHVDPQNRPEVVFALDFASGQQEVCEALRNPHLKKVFLILDWMLADKNILGVWQLVFELLQHPDQLKDKQLDAVIHTSNPTHPRDEKIDMAYVINKGTPSVPPTLFDRMTQFFIGQPAQ